MTGIRHIGVVVSDMERALRFYRDFLGLPVTASYPCRSGGYMSELTALADVEVEIQILESGGDCKLELLCFRSHPGGQGNPALLCDVGRSHVAFTVENLHRLYELRDEFGVAFQTPPIESPDGVTVCFCHDPDGTLVELVEPLPAV